MRRQKALRLMMSALTNKTHFCPGKRLEDVSYVEYVEEVLQFLGSVAKGLC